MYYTLGAGGLNAQMALEGSAEAPTGARRNNLRRSVGKVSPSVIRNLPAAELPDPQGSVGSDAEDLRRPWRKEP